MAEFAKEMEKKGLGKPKVSLQFELHHNGIAQLVKAEAAVEETYTVQEEVEIEDEGIDTEKKPEDADETNKTEDRTAKSEGEDKKEETEAKAEENDDKKEDTKEDKEEDKKEDKKKDKKEEKKKKKTKMVDKVSLLVFQDFIIGIRIHTQMIVVWFSPEKPYFCFASTGKEACPQENFVGGKVLRHKSHSHVGNLVHRVQGQA